MHFTTELKNDVAIEKVNLKHATKNESEEFRIILASHIEKNYKKIVIDLTDCELIDSTFLSVLVWALKELSKVNGQIILVGFKDEVQSLIDVTGLNKIFKAYSNQKLALGSF